MAPSIPTLAIAALVTFALTNASSSTSCTSCKYTVGAPVNTTSGRVIGHAAPNATQVSEYLGIPFAQPPVGQLRFAPPLAYSGTEDFHADKFGHNCPSSSQPVPYFLPRNVYGILAGLAQVGDTPDEDCLTVNVWSKPQTGSAKKPVLVWIYGGGFNSGGTNNTAYSGQFFADQEDVVLVNFNYRVNLFGFPGAPGLTQNVGLLDQRLALEWVRDNIAAFGGDVDRITIFGQSAGGASVDMYNYAYPDDPIIAGSILQSGTADSFSNKSPEAAASAWWTLVEKIGCGYNTTNPGIVLACMRSTSAQNLTLAAKAGSGLSSVLGNFGPTIDDKTVFANYTQRHLDGKYIKKPILAGNNNYEAGLFKLIAAGAGQTLSEDAWFSFDQNIFTCPAAKVAGFRHAQNVPVWRYYNSGMFENIKLPTNNLTSAWHGAELLPLFGSSEEVTQTDSSYVERQYGSYLRGAWAAFAACPESGLSSYGWPEYDPEEQTVILLGASNKTVIPEYALPKDIDIGCTGGALNSSLPVA
ncbi:hypothetical protein FH972_021658 [Carpinus fangiana]|uniref:Carboxylic ester hydrolase n=1 Tax=Carpinus fangiana TaxID=176857 RepID=A0A5N6KQI5_9ROSI|nr:hypothetical protein FH972_021658 [Carpinus fangiana]